MTDRFALLGALFAEGHALAMGRKATRLRLEKPHLEIREIARLLAPSKWSLRGQQETERLRKAKINFVTVLDDDYPQMLSNICDPPLVLFYRGKLSALHRPCISIVGSRSVTQYGIQTTRKLTGDLARLGFTIVSGLALGVDGCAHDACLEVEGLTAAVLGTGIDMIYPNAHRSLADAILDRSGIIVSEFLPGCSPRAFHFPVRNRVISGLCHATIVIEAREKSGSLITARHCLDQGRELFAVPGPIHRPNARGTNGLIHRGEARLLLSPASVLEQLGPLLGLAAEQNQRVKARIENPEAQKIYQMLDAFEPLPLDLLVAELGLDTGTTLAHLVELESLKLVESRPGQCFLRNPLASGAIMPP